MLCFNILIPKVMYSLLECKHLHVNVNVNIYIYVFSRLSSNKADTKMFYQVKIPVFPIMLRIDQVRLFFSVAPDCMQVC